MRQFPFALPNDVAPQLTEEQAKALNLSLDELDQRFVTHSEGMFNFLRWCRGLVIVKAADTIVVHGYRTVTWPKEDGYSLTGRISIGGKKCRAFTSSQLFTMPDGKNLANVAVWYLCNNAAVDALTSKLFHPVLDKPQLTETSK